MKTAKLPGKVHIPKILLIGAGRFGEKHLQTLQTLEKKGKLSIVGAVVNSTKTQKKIEKKYNIKVWTELNDELLLSVDAVDIVTPPETHLEIALRCLPFTNILIEKPLATTTKDAQKISEVAKKYKHIVMVGYIYRFHPVTEKLHDIIAPLKKDPCHITGTFINPIGSDTNQNISLELPHLFDIVNFIFKLSPTIVSSKHKDRTSHISLKYPNKKHALFKLGWEGDDKIRIINFRFSRQEIRCDLILNTIHIHDIENGTVKTIYCEDTLQPLEKEIGTFIDVLLGGKISYPNALTGIELTNISLKAGKVISQKGKNKPKVAIIGGGIFGTNCAIELGKFADVTLFEKDKDIMLGASLVNQYRHHWGYHYPRSDKTVQDIREATEDFENLYDSTIIREFPTYYSIARSDSKTTPKDYLRFCEKHKLPFTLEYPDPNFLNRDKVSICLKTFEPIYDYDKLKAKVHHYIKKDKNITTKFSTEIIGGNINTDGTKTLLIKDSSGKKHKEVFDYVINSTYAQYNKFSHWFKFPIKPMSIDLVEALIVKLPLPRISLAVMDGPFTNLVPTNKKNIFTLVHIKESMLERYVPKNGIPHGKKRTKTMIKETLHKSMEWLPILKEAEVVDVRYIHRAVNVSSRKKDDARPSDVTYHGFGTWSILGGKIVNSVTTAKEISNYIKKYLQ